MKKSIKCPTCKDQMVEKLITHWSELYDYCYFECKCGCIINENGKLINRNK